MDRSCGYKFISFTNVSENEIFTFPLILVKGFVNTQSGLNNSNNDLVVFRVNNDQCVTHGNYRIRHNKFSLLLDLKLGKNDFVFRILGNEENKTFFFVPPDEVFVVTPVYIIWDDNNKQDCDDADKSFENEALRIVCNQIVTGCQFIQTLIAETLFQCGFPKRTFFMENEHDVNGNLECLVFKSSLKADISLSMNAEELWAYFGRELMTSKYGSKNRKFLAFYSNRKRNCSKPLAIGGGGLALCDADYLNTWPASVNELKAWFTDYSYNEAENYFSTGDTNESFSSFDASIGAVCHELCHTFDLGHTKHGMMGTDSDIISLMLVAADRENISSTKIVRTRNINEFESNCSQWTVGTDSVHEELSLQYSTNYNFANIRKGEFHQNKNNNRTRNINEQFSALFVWNSGCASLLAYHRWINNAAWKTAKECDRFDVDEGLIRYDYIRGVITSKNAIVVIQLRLNCGFVSKYWEFPVQQRKTFFLIPTYEIRRASTLLIEDECGNLLKEKLNHFKFS